MNEEKITIWEERIHACQNSDLTVAAWCREHQISVATYYYWRKRVSANDEMLSVKEPVFAELRWSSILVTFTLKKIIDWNISFLTVSCIHLMNVDVYDCNSHIHNPTCFHLTIDLSQTDSVV